MGPVLSSLTVEGFKAHFDAQRLELRPLTVLAGTNSSGKSSAMQALLLIKQTLDALPLDSGGLKLAGLNVHFTSADQFLSRMPGKGRVSKEFSITLGLSDGSAIGSTFSRAGHAVEVAATTYEAGSRTLQLLRGTAPEALALSRFEGIAKFYRPQPLPPGRWASFLVPIVKAPWEGADPTAVTPIGLRHIEHALRTLIHIPGSRGNPLRSFPRTVAGASYPGVFTDLAPAILAEWTRSKSPELKQVNDALTRLELSWKTEATVADAANIEVRVARTPKPQRGSTRDLVNIADVGFGVSQVLPIVVALVVAKRDQLVYIEQPEIHLHPRAIMGLADLLADAARRGVRCIIETHSDVLLRRLQWNIARAEKPLANTDAVFHWFSRDEKGCTKVNSVTPDQSGAYGDWPVDFAGVDADNASQYIAAAEARLADES